MHERIIRDNFESIRKIELHNISLTLTAESRGQNSRNVTKLVTVDLL